MDEAEKLVRTLEAEGLKRIDEDRRYIEQRREKRAEDLHTLREAERALDRLRQALRRTAAS